MAVARLFGGAFGAPVYAYDPFAPDDAWNDIPHTRVNHVDEMLPHVEILTPHLPLTPQTRNLIAWQQFKRMKPGSILINAARGGIVNEEDLIRALNEGIFLGGRAGLP
ncbi:uncharacterized protein A1O9_02917 [Exophiala aquamarina CBS 119918]|uniref:D-isomer specific 2-hydroxyacid dehydrogenase NAD-binding domain-containing protein n=1 Tax=Exophiala aquamarina CBS 119918 TaxID=1182545 RepID=A0A072PNA3_9EURO|nr:uncharacterized protein A1O9_02917 [Exophiala aquamarina CBS 119918]KEF61351.1 hypothetical protein A1O9_02917 [Exophiala aquamarina CBS 119918]